MSTHGFKIDDTSDKDWIIVHDVPILDEHRLHIPADKDGKQAARVVDVNRDLLMRLAANNNRNIRETGDWVPLTEGHTTDDGPESAQPEILGYADDFKVGQLFNTDRQALLARFRISKDPEKLKKAKNLPRRSVELWLDREEINPISLLGSTAPERNLGLLRLQRMYQAGQLRDDSGKPDYEAARQAIREMLAAEQRQRMFQVGQLLRHKDTYRDATGKLRYRATRQTLRFSHELGEMMTPTPGMSPVPGNPVISQETIPGTAPAMQDPAQVQALMAAIQQTDTWQQMAQTTAQMQQMMQQMQPLMQMMGGMGGGQPGMGGDPMAGGMGGGDPMQALIAQLAGGMGGGQGGGNPEEQVQEEEPVQMQAGGAGGGQMGLPGAGSAFLPGMIQNPQTTSDRTVLPRISMSHQNHIKAGETLESAVIRLAAERDEAVKLARKATVVNELLALQTQDGLVLDVNEELPELVEMTDDQRAVRYARMRVRYSKRTTPLGTQTAIPEKPQLPALIPAVGVNTPNTGEQIQQPAGKQDQRMTKEERDMALDIIEQARVVHTRQSPGQPWTAPAIDDVLRLMRQGNVVRLQRNGVPERVY